MHTEEKNVAERTEEHGPSRRDVLRGGLALGAGLVVGFHWNRTPAFAAANGKPFVANAFVRIAPDNTVTVISKHLEMGQGIYTGLATCVRCTS